MMPDKDYRNALLNTSMAYAIYINEMKNKKNMLHKKTQESIALALLQKRPLDTAQAEEVGIRRLAAVVLRLKKRGIKFLPTKMVKIKGRSVAQYKLKK